MLYAWARNSHSLASWLLSPPHTEVETTSDANDMVVTVLTYCFRSLLAEIEVRQRCRQGKSPSSGILDPNQSDETQFLQCSPRAETRLQEPQQKTPAYTIEYKCRCDPSAELASRSSVSEYDASSADCSTAHLPGRWLVIAFQDACLHFATASFLS